MIIILISVLTVFSFFLSASETAVIALSKIKVRHLAETGKRRAKSLQRLVKKLDEFIAAILIGNNFVNIALSAIVTAIFVNFLGYRLGVVAATFVTTLFVLVICEITPKMLATKHTERIALSAAPVMEFFIKIFHPIINIFAASGNLVLCLLRIKPVKRSPLITEEELKLMIEIGKEEGVLSDEERKMLHRIFEFGDTKVSEVMMTKDKLVALDVNTSPEGVLDIFVEQGHARLPVYEGSIENIVGVVYARDVLYMIRHKGLFILQDLLHKPYYVSPYTRVNELLRKFQAEKIQMAIVVDNQQKAMGLVTLEDLLEEIVGEIEETK